MPTPAEVMTEKVSSMVARHKQKMVDDTIEQLEKDIFKERSNRHFLMHMEMLGQYVDNVEYFAQIYNRRRWSLTKEQLEQVECSTEWRAKNEQGIP